MPRRPLQPEELVRQQPKPLDLTFTALKRRIDDAGGDFRCELKVRGLKRARVRLIIRCKRADAPAGWAMAILYNDERIDGIDWEGNFAEMGDGRKSGHHRHVWDRGHRTCKQFKTHLPDIRISTLEEFIMDGLEILRVTLKKEDDAGARQLSIA